MRSFYILPFFLAAVITLIPAKAKSQDTSKTTFKPSGKLRGYVFGDYYDKLHADEFNRGNLQYSNLPVGMNAFDIRRAYLGYDYNINEKFSTDLLLAYDGGTLPDGTRAFYLKNANLRWKGIFNNNDLVIGLQSTPAFSMMSEKIWGYRSIEKTITDMRKICISTDLGISLQGRMGGQNNYGYNLMISDGSGTKPETDIFKKFSADVFARFLNQKMILDLYADYERNQLTPFHKSKTTIKGFAAFDTEPVTIGIEVFNQFLQNNAIMADSVNAPLQDTVNSVATGFSFFVKGKIIKNKLGFFGRFDSYIPDTRFKVDRRYQSGSAPNVENFIVAGLDYSPAKNVHIMPNVWYDGFRNRTSGVTGRGKKDYDLTARITFYYVF